MGRPSKNNPTGSQVRQKMTDDNVQKIITALQNGHQRSSACVIAGVARQTFYDWLTADENFRTRVEDAEEFWLHLVEAKMKEKIDEGYRPAIEKELSSKRKKVYGNKLDIGGQEDNPIKTDNTTTIDIKDPTQIKNAVKDLLC